MMQYELMLVLNDANTFSSSAIFSPPSTTRWCSQDNRETLQDHEQPHTPIKKDPNNGRPGMDQ